MTFTSNDYYQTLKWASTKHRVNISALADIRLLKLYCLEHKIKVNGDQRSKKSYLNAIETGGKK